MIMYSIQCLMSALASACTGLPIRKLWINNPMSSVWNTGAFTSVTLQGWGNEPRQFPITSELGESDADLLFEVECMKSGEADSRKVAVKLHLHDSYGGLWTTVSVICPPEIFKSIDFARMGHGLAAHAEPEAEGYSEEHLIYREQRADCYSMTLVEDIPMCREIVSSLCRELTAQLWAHGYWWRPPCGERPENSAAQEQKYGIMKTSNHGR